MMTKRVHDHDHYENITSEDVKTGSFQKIFYYENHCFALSCMLWYLEYVLWMPFCHLQKESSVSPDIGAVPIVGMVRCQPTHMYVDTHVGVTCGSSACDRNTIHTMHCVMTNSVATSDKLQGMKPIWIWKVTNLSWTRDWGSLTFIHYYNNS